jgi:cytochrome c5
MNNLFALYRRYSAVFGAAFCLVTICLYGCESFNGPIRGEQRSSTGTGGSGSGGVACDTVNVSYTKTILPLLEKHCLGCHAAAIRTAGVNLSGYNNVKFYAGNTLLVGVSSRQRGFVAMPPAGPISDCEMRVIRAWVEQGAKDN